MEAGRIFEIAEENKPLPGCTVSGELIKGVTAFSLAEGTDISPENYPVPVVQYQLRGQSLLVWREGSNITLDAGSLVLKAARDNIGIKAVTDSIYLEIPLDKEDDMNKIVKAGEVFKLQDLVPYQDGKIVNMDLVNNDSMKFVVMAFDKGTGLSEHAAPGDAVVFALDGKAVIGYNGTEHEIHAGEQFHFAKGGLHSVKADDRFKMALLLSL